MKQRRDNKIRRKNGRRRKEKIVEGTGGRDSGQEKQRTCYSKSSGGKIDLHDKPEGGRVSVSRRSLKSGPGSL